MKPYEKHIITTGFVNDDGFSSAFYSGVHLHLHIHLYMKGFGLPPLEAMRCRTPVIVSDRSSLPEVVSDAGLYVDPTNVDDMANQLKRIVKMKICGKICKKKHLCKLKNFTWEKNAKAALNAFESSLKKG